MRLQSLIENIEADQQALEKAVPRSIRMQYRGSEFDNILKTPGAALNLYKVALNQLQSEKQLVNITKALFPYILKDIDAKFNDPKGLNDAYKMIYGLLYKLTTYDEWQQAIDLQLLLNAINDNKEPILKVTLTDFKSFISNSLPNHPTTVRLATIVRKLRSVVDWPELDTVYRSMHTAVFNNIIEVAAQHNYNTEENLIDYISRNKIDLDFFPTIRSQLDNAKEKILLTPIKKINEVERSLAGLKLWVETLKNIGLDWPELDNIQAVYDLAKPIVMKNLLTTLTHNEQYSNLRAKNAVDTLQHFFKIAWPELDVIKKSIKADEEDY